ncbi:Integrase catalytic core protein [Phytophthora palmivora]|uniref:Integrase catalytic core protein n=1 Tax=Phytophthora palmivora TaxID=4796 RepID=A0A2P4Y8F1_9STRA|nr:Integrase catalytic core protein [Phytophthora palmivora]
MTYVQNRTPMSRLGNKTPFKKVYGKIPNISDLQIWGSICFAHVPEERRKDKKLSARSVKCRFLGVSDEYKGYRLQDVYNNRLMYSRHVMLDTKLSDDTVLKAFGKETKDRTANIPQTAGEQVEALRSSHRKQWRQELDLEYDSLINNGTWTPVLLPPGRKVLPCHWVLVVTYHASGVVKRCKARFVAQGNHQEFGVDCGEVYAPVARFASLRLVLAIDTIRDCHIHQMDGHTAFLNGTMDRDQGIYMSQPPRYHVPEKEDLVCELQKSIYGLKQAPRVGIAYDMNSSRKWVLALVTKSFASTNKTFES